MFMIQIPFLILKVVVIRWHLIPICLILFLFPFLIILFTNSQYFINSLILFNSFICIKVVDPHLISSSFTPILVQFLIESPLIFLL